MDLLTLYVFYFRVTTYTCKFLVFVYTVESSYLTISISIFRKAYASLVENASKAHKQPEQHNNFGSA